MEIKILKIQGTWVQILVMMGRMKQGGLDSQ